MRLQDGGGLDNSDDLIRLKCLCGAVLFCMHLLFLSPAVCLGFGVDLWKINLLNFHLYSHFAFYDENETIVEMSSQKVSALRNFGLLFFLHLCFISSLQYYTTDAFGLQTLDRVGKIHIHEISGVQHIYWHRNETVFNCCINPYLN